MTATIYQKQKNALQSGRANTGIWLLEHEPREASKADPLMGWAGSGDTLRQIRLSFPTLDAAKAYAEGNGIPYRIVPEPRRVTKMQAYADNFNLGPVTPR